MCSVLVEGGQTCFISRIVSERYKRAVHEVQTDLVRRPENGQIPVTGWASSEHGLHGYLSSL